MRTTEEEQIYKAVTFYESNEPIGYGEIEIVNDEIWLNHFAIREDYRGKGYGQKVLQFFIEQYGVNTLTCAITNKAARHIYEKYGFKVAEETNDFAGGVVYLMKR